MSAKSKKRVNNKNELCYEYKGKIARISYEIDSSCLGLFFKIDKADVIKRKNSFYIACPTADEDGITLGVKLCKLYKIKDDHYLRIFAPKAKLNYISSNLKLDVSVEIVFNSESIVDSHDINTAVTITLINEF